MAAFEFNLAEITTRLSLCSDYSWSNWNWRYSFQKNIMNIESVSYFWEVMFESPIKFFVNLQHTEWAKGHDLNPRLTMFDSQKSHQFLNIGSLILIVTTICFKEVGHRSDRSSSHLTARKTIFFFFQIFWKDGISKKIALKSFWKYHEIFLVLSGKMIFLFPENMILFFRRKMKDDIFQKKYMEIWCFLQMFWKDGLSKKIALEYDLFVISGKLVLSS